jgi:class 3 adenylate cyclase/tetratricopeptide (TPR) repeat protein
MVGGGASTAERNIITVLAVDMVGSTRHIAACDPDDAQAFLDQWLDHIRGAVERTGGQIVHYAGDGGIAIFGWPSAFEDHADRACIAAWDIQQGPSESTGPGGDPVTFRVAVHSGLVGVRKGGRNAISRFDVAGAAVHVAAKLQQEASPGEILVSAETAKLCRSPLDLTPHKASPVIADRVIRVHGLSAKPADIDHNDVARRYQNRIVNRFDELAALRERLPRRDGRSCSVAVIGEPGIGKSRLAAAAMTGALTPDVRYCVIYGGTQRRTTAFAAACAIIGDLLGPRSVRSDNHLRTALAGLGLEASDRKALEALFVVGKSRSRQRISGNTQTQIARALVNAFLALALTQPTLLLIEDLQLIDPESCQFLKLLAHANKPQPLCLLLTSRPESSSQAADIAESIIHLQALSRAHMEDLGRQLWPENRSAALFARALDRAEGVPFILEELLLLADTTNAPSGQSLPQSVESAIHARLQRLPPKVKAFAQTLSLLGEEVEIHLATAVLGVEIGELLNGLYELERFAFVHPLVGNTTRFRHQIIAEACADTIPRDRRRQIHRAAIRAITLRYPNLSGRYEQLAFHAEEAGETEVALGYLWEAALEARRNSAASSLNLIFDRALKLIEHLGEAAQDKYVDFVLMSFASMLQLGEFKKMKHLTRAMELARRQGRVAQVCGAQSQLGMICWFEGRYEEGLQVTSEGLKTARALNSPALIFSNQLMMANVLHGMGHVDRAISELQELAEMLTGELETARLGAAAIPRSTVLAFMSWFMNATGQYEEALQLANRALEIAVRAQDLYSEVLARSSLGRNLLMLHRNDEAVECLSIAREFSERNGYDAIKANLTGAIATALARTGEARQAIGLVEACLENGMHLRTGQAEVCYLYAGYAEALIRCGESERGLSALDRALTIAQTIKNPWLIVECLGLRARLLAEVAPDDPRIHQDLVEQGAICEQFGMVASAMAPIAAQPALKRPA